MPYKDPEKAKQNKREYAKKNREKINSYHRDYYAKDPSRYVKTRQEYYTENKEDYAVRSHTWYSDSANKMKRRQRIHNIDFDKLLRLQKGLCALGGEELPNDVSKIHVDHDHKTGLIRGLLCRAHNVGLGMFGDSSAELLKAIQYLEGR